MTKQGVSGVPVTDGSSMQQQLREATVISSVSKITNFDYLALREKTNKLYKRVSLFL
jgi:hypothetical protein